MTVPGNAQPGFTRVPVAAPLAMVATTDVPGFALQNATPNIISWTAPEDSQEHRVIIVTILDVSSATTGGQINFSFTEPSGTVRSGALFTASQAAGLHSPTNNVWALILEAGTTVTISQGTAMTAGAATLWAELWGS